jgi:hypothetical protein
VVVSSGRFATFTAADLLPAVKAAGVKRLAVVGGAGSLEIAPGKALIDTPEFPAEYKPEASGGRDFLNALRAEDALDWTFLSPSALFTAGERTGQFRLGATSCWSVPMARAGSPTRTSPWPCWTSWNNPGTYAHVSQQATQTVTARGLTVQKTAGPVPIQSRGTPS